MGKCKSQKYFDQTRCLRYNVACAYLYCKFTVTVPTCTANHLAEVARSKLGRRISGKTPHTPPVWAFLGLFTYPTLRD